MVCEYTIEVLLVDLWGLMSCCSSQVSLAHFRPRDFETTSSLLTGESGCHRNADLDQSLLTDDVNPK